MQKVFIYLLGYLLEERICAVGVYGKQNKITKLKNNKIFERKDIFH
jgi:hypothetical protein